MKAAIITTSFVFAAAGLLISSEAQAQSFGKRYQNNNHRTRTAKRFDKAPRRFVQPRYGKRFNRGQRPWARSGWGMRWMPRVKKVKLVNTRRRPMRVKIKLGNSPLCAYNPVVKSRILRPGESMVVKTRARFICTKKKIMRRRGAPVRLHRLMKFRSWQKQRLFKRRNFLAL